MSESLARTDSGVNSAKAGAVDRARSAHEQPASRQIAANGHAGANRGDAPASWDLERVGPLRVAGSF